MKKIQILKTVIALVIGVLFIVSCEKPEVTTETTQITEEGFKSKTNNSDDVLETNISEATTPLLHMHFDKDVNLEEAEVKWNNAVTDYINKLPVQDKAFSTEWFYKVWTRTGTQSNNETDGSVGTYVRFTTSVGGYNPAFNWMNNSGDDREGGWDAYLFKAAIPGKAIQWVEVDSASLWLKGTDGWFVTDFVIRLHPSNQSISATGFSQIWAYPNVWLDNATDSGWDSYYTGNIGTGRLYF